MRSIHQPHQVARGALGVAALVSLGLALAGCAGGQSSNAGGQPKAGSTASAPAQPQQFASVPTPGPPLRNTSSLRGRTVYWIPITSVAPVFTIESNAAKEAFGSLGINLQVCDGQATPDVVARCVSQAIAGKAAGIIATSIPPEFARQAFGNAVNAKIPTLFVNTADATTPPEWGHVAAAFPDNWKDQAALNNDLIVHDSGEKAHALLVGVTDSSATVDTFKNGMQADLAKKCPHCTITAVPTSSTQISQLTSLVSSALVKDPSINYVFVQYDSFAAPVIQAIRQQNKQGNVKLLTMLGQLDGLKRVASGQEFADTGYSVAALGYNESDILLRMMLGQDPLVAAHVTPIKTINGANVGALDLTEEGWQSGHWQTDADFRAMYRKLWGAQG